MRDTIRESPFGQLCYYLSRGKLFSYPEEQPDFQIPLGYSGSDDPKAIEAELGTDSDGPNDTGNGQNNLAGTISHATAPASTYNADPEAELKRELSAPIYPKKSSDGQILVDWYATDDQANPQNWSTNKKVFVTFLICIYSFAVYFGSSVYVPAEGGVSSHFGVGEQKASLGLSLYVLAYGLGPLLWSPLSEIPVIGRNIPYITSFALFIILCIPTALVENFGGLVFLRFLLGFLGSPCLATGAATLQDMWSQLKLPYAMTTWALSLYLGPGLAPTVSAFSVTVKGFRWASWELLWLSAPIFILFFFFLPETSAANILLRRAKRLRRTMENLKLESQSEIDQRHLTVRAVVVDALIKPTEIAIKDPAVLFTHIYTALIYGIYYSFFEVFPLVYPVMYHFNLGETGAAFLSVVVGATLGKFIFDAMYYFFVEKDIVKNPTKPRPQEDSLQPALIMSILLTASLFWFGWTCSPSIHWIVSLIAIIFFCIASFMLVLSIFVYLPMSYPQYAASIFAANDAVRSSMAAGAIHFAQPLYRNLGVGKGISVVAGVSVLGIVGIWVLYFHGAKMRARSSFAVK